MAQVGFEAVTAERRARTFVVAVLVTLAVVAASCGSSTPESAPAAADDGSALDTETAVDGGSLVIGIATESDGWNPASNEVADAGSLVLSSVLEPLAAIGPDSGAEPWLADSWFPNADFTSWVLKLHPSVTFHDGTPFDAQAVVANMDAYKSGALTSLVLQPMLGESRVIDPLTVQIDLKQPWAAFPSSFLVSQTALMMAPSMIAAGSDGDAHPVGTGPFTFDRWTSGGSFKATRNPSYWRPGLPHLDSIEFQVISDTSARAAALQSGTVNMILETSASTATDLESSFTEVKDWTTDNALIITNTSATIGGQTNPLSNLHARKALAYATDRQAVADLVGPGVDIPTSPWAPSNPWGQPDDQNGYVDFDLDQAKAEVAAYEQDTGSSSLSFTLSGLPDVDTNRVLQLLQSQWADAGIEAKIDTLEQASYITKIATGGFQAAFLRNYGYSDPDMNYHFWSSTTARGPDTVSINFSQFTTPQLDQSLTTGRQSGYVDVRKQAYDDLARQLNAGFANIWLYRTPYTLIADKQVRGLQNPRQISFANSEPKTWLGDLWRAPQG